MPNNNGTKEEAILVFAMPRKPKKGVLPPTESKPEKSALPGMSEEQEKPESCEYCEGEGCEHCDYKGYHEEDGYEVGAEDSHKKHMRVISKLVEMLDKE
jgi:hypothetical protein